MDFVNLELLVLLHLLAALLDLEDFALLLGGDLLLLLAGRSGGRGPVELLALLVMRTFLFLDNGRRLPYMHAVDDGLVGRLDEFVLAVKSPH